MDMPEFYKSLKRRVSADQYSDHWSKGHYGQFASLLADDDALSSFRSNGFADGIGGSRFEVKSGQDSALQRTNAKSVEMHRQAYETLCAIAGTDFVRTAVEADVGNPHYVLLDDIKTNLSDLRNVYNAWRISRLIEEAGLHQPVFMEIGAGFGCLPAKLMSLFPKATYIIIDLPESLALQRYYLGRLFPDARFQVPTELEASLDTALSQPGFVFLPAGTSDIKLGPDQVDCAINIRSMMEMTPDVIESYFTLIQRSLRIGGFFYCLNRYHKQVRHYAIRLKSYPFDDNWFCTTSGSAWNQPNHHELIAVRTALPNAFPLRQALAGLPSFQLRDVAFDLASGFRKLKTVIVGTGLKTGNPGLVNILRGHDEPLKESDRNILYGKGWRMRLKRTWLALRNQLPREPGPT